jgi:hypothetical protein
MSSRFLRFRDLKERGIVDSWAQLDNLIKKYGFSPGRMLSPNVRVWDEEKEIEPWLASRPVAGNGNPVPRGAAKTGKGRPPKDGRPRKLSAKQAAARQAAAAVSTPRAASPPAVATSPPAAIAASPPTSDT